jgi:phosphoribosylformylglycinamidine synthase PurS subunit
MSSDDAAGATKATVIVRLKGEVLDPQGDAVAKALSAMGFAGVAGVRIGKIVEIEFDAALATDREALKLKLAAMADSILANPVIEEYEVVVK